MFGNIDPQKPTPVGSVEFHPLNDDELTRGQSIGFQLNHYGLKSMHRTYTCGACGDSTNGRVLCEVARVRNLQQSRIFWCWCSCAKAEPTILIEEAGAIITQLPTAKEFHAGSDWPTELAQLYEEAAKAYSAGAYTATGMVCRKLLMACACDKSAQDGRNFTEYVDHITTNVLTFQPARSAIDAIRTIGNEANHHVQFVNQADALRAMKIVTYMLNTIYSLPAA